jgi:hypothetical protein
MATRKKTKDCDIGDEQKIQKFLYEGTLAISEIIWTVDLMVGTYFSGRRGIVFLETALTKTPAYQLLIKSFIFVLYKHYTTFVASY